LNANIFPTFGFKNNLIYKRNNNYFKFGYFTNIDGVGLELGYRTGGIDFTFPLLFLLSDLDVETEINVPFSDSIVSFVKNFFLFTAVNLMTRTIIKKIKNFRKSNNKGNDAKKLEKARNEMTIARTEQERICNQLSSQANKKHQTEVEKDSYGLIIHYAIYGNRHILKEILQEKPDELNNSILHNIENEVIDVTTPVRFLIQRDEKITYASILFHHVPKTKIIGFINPIFKNDKTPSMLIK
jgi:hypothetical protein